MDYAGNHVDVQFMRAGRADSIHGLFTASLLKAGTAAFTIDLHMMC